MGKAKRLRTTGNSKTDPLGIRFLETTNNESDVDNLGPIASIRDQLLNPNVEEKIHGLQALAVVALNKNRVDEICKTDIVRIAAPFLCEDEDSLRNATAGALRNLSIAGEKVCEWLTNQDILTPLTALVTEYIEDSDWIPKFDSSLCNQLDLKSDIFLQAINIIWNLCETNSLALDIFNGAHLIGGLIRCLNHNIYGLDIAIATAQCLLVVSENNPKSWILLNEHVDTLLDVLQLTDVNNYGQIYLVSLCAGVLSNVPALATAYTPLILNNLAKVLEVDHCATINKELEPLSYDERNQNQLNANDIMDTEIEETEEESSLRRRREEQPTEVDLIVKDISYLLDGQRVAAEVIANLCSLDNEIDDNSSEHSMDESVEDNHHEDMEYLEGETLSQEVINIIKSNRLLEKLWTKSQAIPEETELLLRSYNTNFISKILNLRISSLLSLNNITNCLSLEEMGGTEAVYSVWVKLGQCVFIGSCDVKILESSTTLMRSVLDKFKSEKNVFNEMTEDDVMLIVNGATEIDMPEIRANWLRMLGTLGCVLQSEKLVRTITLFILNTCKKEEDCWTISEGLDAFMDIFSEDVWNHLVQELNLLEICQELEMIFKAKLRNQRRELKERFQAVHTVLTNFSRFLKYIEEIRVNKN